MTMRESSEEWTHRTGGDTSRRRFLRTLAGVSVATAAGVSTVSTATAEGGDLIWEFETGDPVFSSPTVVDGTAFVGSQDENVYALDASEGTELWRFDTGGDVNSSPMVTDGTVYIGSHNDSVYALDATTGDQRWRFDTGGAVRSSPTVADDVVFVGSDDNNVYALDATTGDQQWRVDTGGWVRASPTVADGIVFVGSQDENVYALDAATGDQRWRFDAFDWVFSSPTVADDTVFVGSWDSNLYALDAATGDQRWRFDTGGAVRSSPTVADDVVFVGSDDNNVYALDATTGDQQWRVDTGGAVRSSPTVTDDVVFVGSGENNVYALDATTGDQQWRFGTGSAVDSRFGTGSAVDSSPTVADGIVFVGSDDTTVYALDAGAVGSSADSRVVLGTLGHHGDWGYTGPVINVRTGINTLTQTPTETDTLTPTPTETENGQSWSVEQPGMWGLVLSGGGLAILIWTYALSRRSTDDESDSQPDPPTDSGGSSSTGSATSADTTTAEDVQTVATTSDPAAQRKIDRRIGAIETRIGDARKTRANGAYDRALEQCQQAIEAAEATNARAEANAPNRIEETDALRQEAEQLAAAIEGERDTHDKAELVLDTAEHSLDAAADAIETSDATDAREHLKEASTKLADATSLIADYEFEDLDTRIDSLRDRHENLHGQATRLTLETDLAELETRVDNAHALVEDAEHEAAIEEFEAVMEDVDELAARIVEYDDETLQDRFATLREQCEDGIDQSEAALTTSQIPENIPSAPRLSLEYTDVEKVELLGKGGNADVFHATTQTADGQVALALKEPRVSGTLHTETVERMLDEAETWQRLDDHDHIVSVVDYGSEPLPWIAMEYMDGGHLGDQMATMDLPQKVWTALAVTEGVYHAHRRGIAHRDLKPENILFCAVDDAWDVPKVADWGLSKHLLNHSKSMDGFSPHYAAPEQFDSDSYGDADQATDIYQLGAVFYELFTGQPPFEGPPFEVMNKIQHEEPTPPSELVDLPVTFDDVLLDAVAARKEHRYEDVLLLRNDLQELFESL